MRDLFNKLGAENTGGITYLMFEEKITSPEVKEYFESLGLVAGMQHGARSFSGMWHIFYRFVFHFVYSDLLRFLGSRGVWWSGVCNIFFIHQCHTAPESDETQDI